MVPRLLYRMRSIARTLTSPIRRRSSGDTAGEGLSSMSFWWRRWTEHSRSPKWSTLPCSSATIWISTCRGFSTYRSMYMSPLPKAEAASAEAVVKAVVTASRPRTIFIPRPPPPAAALRMTG